MNLLGLINTADQDVAVNGVVNLGNAYRRYCTKNNCGVTTFSTNGTSVTLQQKGIYHITATITFTAPVAGDVIFQLTENGVALPGATATETVTTATTEFNTTVIDYYVLVGSTILLNKIATEAKAIAIVNTGVASTVTNVVFNVDKVL